MLGRLGEPAYFCFHQVTREYNFLPTACTLKTGGKGRKQPQGGNPEVCGDQNKASENERRKKRQEHKKGHEGETETPRIKCRVGDTETPRGICRHGVDPACTDAQSLCPH